MPQPAKQKRRTIPAFTSIYTTMKKRIGEAATAKFSSSVGQKETQREYHIINEEEENRVGDYITAVVVRDIN